MFFLLTRAPKTICGKLKEPWVLHQGEGGWKLVTREELGQQGGGAVAPLPLLFNLTTSAWQSDPSKA